MADNQEKVTRGVFYAFTRIILCVLAVLIIALGFFAGMNSMNVNVIAKDAFAKRIEVALQPKEDDETDLAKLFTQECIDEDAVINSTKYKDYTITSYYQRADVNMKIVWPWSDRVVVHATENVLDIVGTLNESEETIEVEATQPQQSAAQGDETQIASKDKNPPEWICGEYDVTLVKDKDTSSWKVEEMKLTKEIEPKINAPSQSPSPSGSVGTQESATPSATQSASESPSLETSAE